jgi:hypothetical protein
MVVASLEAKFGINTINYPLSKKMFGRYIVEKVMRTFTAHST